MIITRFLFVIMFVLITLVLTLVSKVEAFSFDAPLQFEAEYSVVTIKNVKILYLAVTDNIAVCNVVCFPQGIHFVYANTEEKYFIAGFDLFAKIKVKDVWQRWGLGLSVFNKQTEELQTPWDIHASMQSGYKNFACSLHHWSNGRGGAKRLGIERFWPDRNDGANAITCGIVYEY